MSQEALVSLFVGSIVSVAATWVFSYIYYRRAGQDLVREAERLRQETERGRQETERVQQLVNVLARALRHAGVLGDVAFNANGELTSFTILRPAGISSDAVMGTATVTLGPPPTTVEVPNTIPAGRRDRRGRRRGGAPRSQ